MLLKIKPSLQDGVLCALKINEKMFQKKEKFETFLELNTISLWVTFQSQ